MRIRCCISIFRLYPRLPCFITNIGVKLNTQCRRLTKILPIIWSGIALCIAYSNPASAQTDTSRTLNAVKLEADATPPVKSVTPSQRITASDFKRYSAYNAADAIRNFSGVTIKDYGGIGGLKTVSVRSLGANYTGVLLDGIQIGDAQNGQVDLGKINLDNVASITLFNGQPGEIVVPARSFAAGSLLMIESIRPSLQSSKPYQLKAGIKTGSFGLFNPMLQWQQRITDRLSISATNSIQNATGKYKYKVDGDGSDTLATRTNGDVKTAQSDLSVFYIVNDSSRVSLRANFMNSDRGLPGAVVFYNPYSSQRLRNRDYFIQSGYEKKWRDMRLLLNAKFSENYTRYVDPDYLNNAGFLYLRYSQREAYGSAVVSYKLTENLEAAYAADIAGTTLKTNQYQYAYPERFTYLNALSSKLAFGKLKLQGTLLNTLIHETVKSGTAAPGRSVWSPSLAGSYQPSDTSAFMIRAFYKNIFRNPTFNDLYYTRIGNRSLKPEYATQYNLGFTYTKPGKRLSYLTLTTDVYYNRIKDKIIAIPNKDLFTWTMLNLGRVAIRGADVAVKTQLPVMQDVNASFSGNYTFQKAIDVKDKASSVYHNQIPYTPEHTFSLNAGLSGKHWGVFYDQIYSSHRYYLSENLPAYYVPGFMVGDLALNYRFDGWRTPLSLSAEINNVFNTSYAFIRSFPMPGRAVRLSIQLTI